MATAGLSILMFFALALASTEAAAKNSKGHKEDHAGPYVIVIHSIKDLNENYKEYANWSLRVTKKTKKGPPYLEGFMHFIKETRNLEHEMIVMKKDESMGKGDNWKTYMVNEMKPGPVCSNMIQVIFFKQFKDIKWDITCTFKPQRVNLIPIDINEKLHAVMEKAEYGMFKVDLKYWRKDPTLPKGQEPDYVIRFETIVSVQRPLQN